MNIGLVNAHAIHRVDEEKPSYFKIIRQKSISVLSILNQIALKSAVIQYWDEAMLLFSSHAWVGFPTLEEVSVIVIQDSAGFKMTH